MNIYGLKKKKEALRKKIRLEEEKPEPFYNKIKRLTNKIYKINAKIKRLKEKK